MRVPGSNSVTEAGQGGGSVPPLDANRPPRPWGPAPGLLPPALWQPQAAGLIPTRPVTQPPLRWMAARPERDYYLPTLALFYGVSSFAS